MFMVINVNWSLKDVGTVMPNGSGLQKCPERAQRQRPGGEQDKSGALGHSKSVCKGQWQMEPAECPMGKSEAEAAVGRELLKVSSQASKTERTARRLL